MLSIQLLGQFTLSLDGKRLELPSRPAQSLLAWLVLYPNIAHRREQIAGLLWPDATEENARNNLRHALWRLRRAIPRTFIQSDRIAIRWLAGTEWRLDVTALVDTPADVTSADALLPGLAAYAGELLPGFYDDWIIRERERLSALFAERIARALELLQSERRWHETIDWTERWIAQGETPELAYRVLMIAHASLGNSSAALATYQRCTEALGRELGVPPSPETTALADSIRTAQFDLLHSPQSASAPPTHSPVVRTNLPAATTPLIGRDAELAHLSGLLTDSAHRLVTILGPGGMGKSRLALAAGHASLDHFPDGVFLVELVALSSAREIPRAISDALGYAPQNDTRPLRQQILDALRGRTLLLLLDNFDHLLEGSAFLVEMLEAAPGLHLLVTSRERLRLHAETLFRLNGLVYPSSGQTAQTGREFGAVELFVRSAQRTQQDFAPGVGQWPAIAHICRMVDGLPLGIVLAAGWSNSLSITEIAAEMAADADFLAQEMGDLDPRHRAITRVFEQSWQRLSVQEQQALAGMCLFAGGFDRESARAVAGAPLSVLSRLVDKSLLWRVGEGRYDLHELVRQLARQKLISSGEEAARRTSHCRWFLVQVAWQEARLKGSEQDKAIAQMESEWENIRAAWLWAVKTGEGELLQRAIEPLGIFCSLTGHWEEGEGLMAGALSGLGEPATPQAHLLYGWFLAWHGVFFHTTGKPALAQTRMAQALALVEDSPQPSRETRRLRAFVYLHRGGDLMTNRQRAAKIDDMLQALVLFQELDTDWWTVQTLIHLAHAEIFNGSSQRAMEMLQDALRLARRSDIRSGEAETLRQMSFVAEQMGQAVEGERLAREAVAMTTDQTQQQPALGRLAFVLLSTGKFEESIAISRASVEWARTFGSHPRHLAFTYCTLARGLLDVGQFAEGKATAIQGLQCWKDTYGWEQPFVLRAVAMGALALGDVEEARRLIHQTLESQQQMGNGNLFALSGAYIDCCYPALALNRQSEVRELLLEGLDMARRAESFAYEGVGYPAAALWLAKEGRLLEAAFVNGAIQNLPRLTGSRWYAKAALDSLAGRLASLPTDMRSTAETQGRTLELPKMTGEVLALLGK